MLLFGTPVGPSYPDVFVASDTRDQLGECPVWDATGLSVLWVDFYDRQLRRLTEGSTTPVTRAIGGSGCLGAMVLCTRGRVLLVANGSLQLLDEATGNLLPFADPNAGRQGVAYNDAKVDRQGRMWVGSFDEAERDPRGVLFRVEPNGASEIGDAGFVVCNGPAFSPEGTTLYFSDSIGQRILAYTLDPATGSLGGRRVFATISPGIPDGLCVDSAGNLWCAIYGEGTVHRYDPAGRLTRIVGVPVAMVTSCCLGGRNLDTLFITTGRAPASTSVPPESRRYEGALLTVSVDVPGLPEPLFDPVQCK